MLKGEIGSQVVSGGHALEMGSKEYEESPAFCDSHLL